MLATKSETAQKGEHRDEQMEIFFVMVLITIPARTVECPSEAGKGGSLYLYGIL